MSTLARKLIILLVALTGCAGISDQDRLDIREAVFREFLPTIREWQELVFIAFDYRDSLAWEPPPVGFIERLSGLNEQLTLRSVADMEIRRPPRRPRGFLGYEERSTERGGGVCSVEIVSTTGGEVTISLVYSKGLIGGRGYRAVMKKQKGKWVMIRKLNGWVS